MKASIASFAGHVKGNFLIEHLPLDVDAYNLSSWLGRVWLEENNSYDHGALTAYLLRRFGLPNLLAYDDIKHGARWGIEIGNDGLMLEIEPRPNAPIKDWACLSDTEKSALSNRLGTACVFSLSCISEKTLAINFQQLDKMVRGIIKDFRRPTFWRDTYANALGVLSGREMNNLATPEISGSANIAIHPKLESKRGTYKIIDEDGDIVFLDDSFNKLSSKKTNKV